MAAATNSMNMSQMSMGQKVDIVAGLLSYPALTILIFCRRRVGYRTLRPYQIVLMFLILEIVPPLFAQHCTIMNGCSPSSPVSLGMVVFPWVFLITGFAQRWIRWRELVAGKAWHSYSRGVSYWEWLTAIPLNNPLFKRIPVSFVYRAIDAAAVAGVAMIVGILPPLHGLARWMFFSAGCMLFVENYVYDKQLDRELDTLDSLVEGEVHAQIALRYGATNQGQAAAPSLSETAGIPSGLGPDISRQVDARRKTGHGIAGDKLAAV